MEARKTINEFVSININNGDFYKKEITFGELKSLTNVLTTDIVHKIQYVEKEISTFGFDESRTHYTPTLVLIRKRPETDEEFFKRKQEEEIRNSQQLEKEKLEYLRLKAKFEQE